MDEEPRRGVPREGITKLLGRPRSRGVGGHRDVQNASSRMVKNDHHVQQTKRQCRHSEEVRGGDLIHAVVREGRPPFEPHLWRQYNQKPGRCQ